MNENNNKVKNYMNVSGGFNQDVNFMHKGSQSERVLLNQDEITQIKAEADFIKNKWKNIIQKESPPQFVYNPKTTSKEELLICEKMSPLLTGSVIYKRNTFNHSKNLEKGDQSEFNFKKLGE